MSVNIDSMRADFAWVLSELGDSCTIRGTRNNAFVDVATNVPYKSNTLTEVAKKQIAQELEVTTTFYELEVPYNTSVQAGDQVTLSDGSAHEVFAVLEKGNPLIAKLVYIRQSDQIG